ncbi:potassium-transporting ATPase subunit KdpC [Lacisediminihabitans profunda]|uniref:Potassium-transporting ATPase KdpC subunit n=1 Tax=Lacisediminihabitans profunda TaxID=2594790 RepID=A0A5C8UV42_9MICO|nr:potassium-transporting ATPase subunit KdpC [Lacisediminihabitans profunda]TXN32176.1 potassium-transporting ATPase subunit KdpC [Lacisediminihabitans profunda]
MSSARGTTRQYWVALKAMVVFTVVLGIGYPALIGAIGLLAPAQANGSPVAVDGKTVGSSLIGQSFTNRAGGALPQWFQSRPSAAGTGYDAGASGGSNQGTESGTLASAIKDRKAAIAKSDGVDPASIPPDALTASASGLDPQISPEYAREQVARVAAARSLPRALVAQLVERFVTGRSLGFIGEPTVNVLELNIALAALDPSN